MPKRPAPPAPCPNADQHTDQPRAYVAASLWAEEMLRTHHQLRCPGCDLWAIWVPTPGAPDLPPVAYRMEHKSCMCCDGDPGCDCRWHDRSAA
jgi:hypothetical protein